RPAASGCVRRAFELRPSWLSPPASGNTMDTRIGNELPMAHKPRACWPRSRVGWSPRSGRQAHRVPHGEPLVADRVVRELRYLVEHHGRTIVRLELRPDRQLRL